MAMELDRFGINCAAIYRPLNNYFLNPIMEYLRKKYICPFQIPKGRKGMREIISKVKDGCSVALMVDQRVGEGIKINCPINQAANKLNLFFKKNKINLRVEENYFPITKNKYSKLNSTFPKFNSVEISL